MDLCQIHTEDMFGPSLRPVWSRSPGTKKWHFSANSSTSTMCCHIVLLEDKNVPSNAADRWWQLLRQQHISIILPVGLFSPFGGLRAVYVW